MPRTIYTLCSGICLLFTTALPGQSPHSRQPSLQQVVGYHLRQQKEWQHRQLPPNSILFRYNPNYNVTHTFVHSRSLVNSSTNSTPYGFSIKPTYSLYPDYSAALGEENSSQLLDLYMSRYKVFYTSFPATPTWTDPGLNIGSILLRSIIESRRSAPGSIHRPPKRP